MTDNEIKKVLECCSKYVTRCGECPLLIPGGCGCINKYELALDLVNRLEAENSNLTSNLTSLQNDLTSAKAEIERLKQIIKDSHSICEDCKEKYAEEFEDAKAEARKEFWERLKKEADFISGGDYGFSFEIREDIADNLLKEMEGEE